MSSILRGLQLNEVNPHNYDSDWDYQNAVANSGRSRFSSSDSYDAHDAENDAYEMHRRFAATRARKEAEAKAAAEKAKTGEQGVAEGELTPYLVSVMDPVTGEHWRIEVKVTSPEMAKERAEAMGYKVLRINEKQGVAEQQLDELSPQTLANYKKKAGADATAADKRGDYKRGNKRMSGIVKATKKEFANDAKGVNEGYIAEGKILLEARVTHKLWESAGQKIAEAQLTADQINQIFGYVEKIQSAGGGNRTLIGKGKDAASAVNQAWEDLKTKVQNSGPIKNVDAMYDQAAEKLKQATGGDQGVMQYVQKYRDFAKQHPVAQSLIYSALIAAAGISGVGVGGAAALGLFKMVDKLLQGEKFSSAAYSGAKTGALAYGAGQVGQAMKGTPQGQAPSTDAATAAVTTGGRAARDAAVKTARETIASRIANGDIKPNDFGAMRELAQKMIADVPGLSAQSADTAAEQAITYFMKGMNESVNLSESQIYLVIGKMVDRQRKLDEGIMDTIKGAAGSAMDWAKTKGTNLTTKVTADKLLQAWKKAGSPTDSLDVASIVQQAGVSPDTIKQVFTNMKIPVPGTSGSNTATRDIPVDPSSTAPAVAQSSPATAVAPAQQIQTTYADVKKLVDQLDSTAKQRVVAALKKNLGSSMDEGSMGTAVSQPPGSTVSAGQRFYKPRHVPNQDEIQAQDELDENCWKGYHKEGNKELFGKTVPNCVKNEGVAEEQHSCPHCGGELVSEDLMNEKKDACYYKVKSRYKVWPSAYASGALVKCRKSHGNWGNGGKKNESSILEGLEQVDENLHQWFKEKWVRFGPDGKIRGDCARGDDSEGKPKCLPQSKAQSLGKKGRASAAARKRREDPNPERSGKAINVNTKKKSNEGLDEGWKEKLAGVALTGALALGAGGAHARIAGGDEQDPSINRLTGKPITTQQATDTAPAQAEAPKGFSKEYLQKAANPERVGRFLISVEKAQELLKGMP
jgi:hypothetical protein